MVLPVSGGVLWCVSVQMYSECPLSCPRVPTHWHQHQCLSLQSPVASDTVLTRDPRADRQHRHVNYHQTCPILRLKTTRPRVQALRMTQSNLRMLPRVVLSQNYFFIVKTFIAIYQPQSMILC